LKNGKTLYIYNSSTEAEQYNEYEKLTKEYKKLIKSL